jgi:hypothetical protein
VVFLCFIDTFLEETSLSGVVTFRCGHTWGTRHKKAEAAAAGMAQHMKGAPTSDSEALELFRSLDKNSDHVLSMEEFQDMARTRCFDANICDMMDFLKSFDTDEEGLITEAEFLAFFRKMRSLAQKHRYEAALAPRGRPETPSTPVGFLAHDHHYRHTRYTHTHTHKHTHDT